MERCGLDGQFSEAAQEQMTGTLIYSARRKRNSFNLPLHTQLHYVEVFFYDWHFELLYISKCNVNNKKVQMYKKVENGQDFSEHEKRARIPAGSNFCCH